MATEYKTTYMKQKGDICIILNSGNINTVTSWGILDCDTM